MPDLVASELSTLERYMLMTSTIVPRPIAWVTSMDADGRLNLAPFSFFQGVSAKPPLVSVSVSRKRSGEPKDTWANIEATKEFVIHSVDEAHAHVMVETSAEVEHGEDEAAMVGLKTVTSDLVQVPRLADAPVAMECRLVEIYTPAGDAVGLIVGEVLKWHVRDGFLKEGPRGSRIIDVHKLRPLSRLGGKEYAPVREVFEMQRPSAEDRSGRSA
ncbi:MAG: flavin reductase family protein [Euryarchaeota archaeon]|nr:flavin reductase family protein [Euryarchaeota archaeon]